MSESTIDWTKPIETVDGEPLISTQLGTCRLVAYANGATAAWSSTNRGAPVAGDWPRVRNVPAAEPVTVGSDAERAAKPDPSRVVTPKGRTVTFWNVPQQTPGCTAVVDEVIVFFVRGDGTLGKHSTAVECAKVLREPNRWPLPDNTAERIDAYLDALAPAAAKGEAKAEPWTFETMPVAVKVRLACGAGGPKLAIPKNDDYAIFVGEGSISYSTLFRDYEQLDGTPCGKTV